ncbi:hypothetical protein BX616_007119 [Lobosporangium transversale]|uniref:Thioredoxin-like protein n=1 Tax=Lobosporangium transversale TaxID=64571 RepID=A0A1Y2H4Y4_9FUNG|nr:thioredoxin-like protein [Lobosporangium transversale]KAF9915009.1 hypothetical protein BX616_007119 [Lobosporangium transversale]ORZ29041.1 thioredoxin-like protein [Lobosporangium transversale]|eukprot:XP_021886714.1 thioredoxin-like protein [Lobosporangium transversale]
MEGLSTKPKPVSMVTGFSRSRRIRGLVLLLVLLCGIYYLFFGTTKRLGSGGGYVQNRVDLNGEGEPLDITQDISSNHRSGTSQVSLLEKRIQGLIDSNRIMVFSKSYCPYSMAAKKLLRSYTNDIQVLEVDLEEKSTEIKAVLTKLAKGHSTFPSIFINGEPIGGNDNLQALEDKDQLQSRLQKLGVPMLQ